VQARENGRLKVRCDRGAEGQATQQQLRRGPLSGGAAAAYSDERAAGRSRGGGGGLEGHEQRCQSLRKAGATAATAA